MVESKRDALKNQILAAAMKAGMPLNSKQLRSFMAKNRIMVNTGRIPTNTSFALACKRARGEHQDYFRVIKFRVLTEFYSKMRRQEDICSEATVKIKIGKNKPCHRVAEGKGPIDALSNALKLALLTSYDIIKDIRHIEFSSKASNMPEEETAAPVEVNITFKYANCTWKTTGISKNFILAAMRAMTDGFEWFLSYFGQGNHHQAVPKDKALAATP